MLLFNYHSLLLNESMIGATPEALKTTMLCFYSTLAQSMAALIAIIGTFLVFRLETIKSERSRGIDNFRSWVEVRVQANNQSTKLIRELEINWEPNSWLEKDILDHIDEALKKAKETNHPYTKALTDYYQFIKSLISHQERIKCLAIPLLAIISFIFLNAIYNIVIMDLLVIKYRLNLYEDIVCNLSATFFVIIYLIVFLIYAILEPRKFIINTPKTK